MVKTAMFQSRDENMSVRKWADAHGGVSRRAVVLSGLSLSSWAGGREPLPMQLDDAHWREMPRTRGIEVGNTGMARPFYVFFDPNCPYCAKLWTMPLPEDLGGAMARYPALWVPVSYLKQSSHGRAVALLRGGDARALARNFEEGFDHEGHEGGIPPLEPLLSERLIMERNNRIWKAIAPASPVMVWMMRSTHLPARWMGLPSPQKLETFLRDVAG